MYNINEVVVESGLESEYIRFSGELNEYLKRKYARYYIGLQLYESKSEINKFFIVACYRNLPEIYKVSGVIGKDITTTAHTKTDFSFIEEEWGDKAERYSLLTFTDCIRRIPSQRKD